MKISRFLACALTTLCAVAVATGCSADVTVDPGATLRVENRSDFSIVELRVTSVGSSTWGPNLLGNDPLFPGEALTLDVNCGTYDALLVDDTNVDCELHNLDLCLNDADWIIRNNTCTVFGAAKAAREAAAAAANANTSGAASATDAGTP